MITVRQYAPADAQIWDDFVNHSRMPMFMFNRGFMDYHADRFQDDSLMFYREDELMAVLPATRHDAEVRSHGGLTYGGMIVGEKMKQHTMLECFEAMRAYYRAQGVTSILYKTIPHIYHHQPAEEELYALFRQNAMLVRRYVASTIDLRHPVKMPKGRKAQISRAKREGVTLSDSDDFASFIALENAVLQDRHGATAVHSAAELALLASRFPQSIRLIVAKRNDELLAGAVLFVYPNLVHTQYLANSDTGCEIGALDLLISELIKEYTGKVDFFDMGTSMADSENGLNNGLIAQKEGFGGRAVMYDCYRLGR